MPPVFNIKKPFIFIIFGASGDLARLKLFPAIYQLMLQKRLPEEFYVVGYSRTKWTNEEFRQEFSQSIKKNEGEKLNKSILKELLKNVHYFHAAYDDLKQFKNFKKQIESFARGRNIPKIAYFSVPPTAFKPIIQNLGETKNSKNEDIRLVLEKPFGVDTQSAEDLFRFAMHYFNEKQIYLLDHYLGKAGVQSILHLRHGNRILNLLLKGEVISNIQITASESIGVKERAGYFDQVGALKDMVQSHLLQVLAILTMSIPIRLAAESIHREKYNILSTLAFPKSKKNIVIGQYDNYKKEKDVPQNSLTETFVALKLFIDRESWYKVPIYLRTGKKLSNKCTYIVIEIKKFNFQTKDEEPNRVVIELQPEETINIQLLNRHGVSAKYQEIKTSESIAYRGEDKLNEHGIFLLDIIRGRKLRFLSFQEVLATWRLTDEILDFIKKAKVPLRTYEDASRGPKEQNEVTAQDNLRWFELC